MYEHDIAQWDCQLVSQLGSLSSKCSGQRGERRVLAPSTADQRAATQ